MSDDGEHERLTGNAGGDPAPSTDQRGDGPGEQPDWDVPKRVLAFTVAAVAVWAGIWLGGHAVRYAGPLLVGLGMFLGAAVLLVAGAALTAVGLLGVRTRRGQGESGDPVEQEAERRGMPTDPEAYQDGGVGVAATGRTTTEAELIAAELNARDIPAWVDQAYASTVLWHAQFALNPEGVRVLVPLGRLADARRVVDENRDQEGTSEEDEEPAPRRSLRRTGTAIFFLCYGLVMMVFAIIPAYSAATYGPREVVGSILMGFLGFGALTAGVLGLRTKPEPQD